MIRNKNKYNFILILSGIDDLDETVEDALFEAGCDDATLSFHNQAAYLEFDREAYNLKDPFQFVQTSGPTDLISA